MSAWGTVEAGDNPRGMVTQATVRHAIQSMELSASWGSKPGTATLVYVSSTAEFVPIAVGSLLKITSRFGHLLYGVCKSYTATNASGGRMATVEFEDLRAMLSWDDIYGCWNMPEKRVESGRVSRRYWHILPTNFSTYTRTFTAAPYTAREILWMMLRSPWTQSPWDGYWDDLAAPYLNYPALAVDCLSGKKLDAALLEVTERVGLLFTLASTEASPYLLRWTRKGFGGATFPANSDDRRLGASLSGYGTRVRVLGDRNVYQVLNVGMSPDWSRAWEEFTTPWDFVADVFYRFTLDTAISGIPAGTAYSAIPGDEGQVVGWQLAAARARTMTVGQYARARGDTGFNDARMYAGRARNDLPAMTYIGSVMFRAWRPGSVVIGGASRPLHSLRMVGQMLAELTHDPAAAQPIRVVPGGLAPAGNGYAVVKGYNLGADLFNSVRPEHFRPDQWYAHQQIWSPVGFSIDDSSEDGGFILFDEPVIQSASLVQFIDGFAVLDAQARPTLPAVVAALTFEAEPFQYVAGTGGVDMTENVTGLHFEGVLNNGGTASEVPYDDGMTAAAKAQQIAIQILDHPWAYLSGGYVRKLQAGNLPTQLGSAIDRVTFSGGPQGFMETVDFSKERGTRYFIPERDFDRRVRERSLVGNEQELREQARQLTTLASGLRSAPWMRQQLWNAFTGVTGGDAPTTTVRVESGSGTLLAGTPLWRKPLVAEPDRMTQALAVMPASSTDDHAVFAGVTVRQNEPADRPLPAQTYGVARVRVLGPVAVSERVVKANGNDYLVAASMGADDAPEAGTSLQEISGDTVQLIEVRLGGGGGGTVSAQDPRYA